jgi:hypothetical protein
VSGQTQEEYEEYWNTHEPRDVDDWFTRFGGPCLIVSLSFSFNFVLLTWFIRICSITQSGFNVSACWWLIIYTHRREEKRQNKQNLLASPLKIQGRLSGLKSSSLEKVKYAMVRFVRIGFSDEFLPIFWICRGPWSKVRQHHSERLLKVLSEDSNLMRCHCIVPRNPVYVSKSETSHCSIWKYFEEDQSSSPCLEVVSLTPKCAVGYASSSLSAGLSPDLRRLSHLKISTVKYTVLVEHPRINNLTDSIASYGNLDSRRFSYLRNQDRSFK